MDGRDSFLTMARDQHLEFSSLRRCKYSSLAMLYELHTQAMVRGEQFKIIAHTNKMFSFRVKINLCTPATPVPSLWRLGITAQSATTLTCAWLATRRTAIPIRWRSSALILTVEEVRLPPPAILRRRGSSASSAVSRVWCTRVSAGMPTADCRAVTR